MSMCRLFLCSLFSLLFGIANAQQTPKEVASSFLPPGTRMAELQRFDPKTGNPIETVPAVLSGHFVSPDSNDLAFAYVNASKDPQAKSLFVTVLHRLPEGYAIVFEKSFYQRFLRVQDFATTGLKTLRLPGELVDSIAITTARGASLGAQTELYLWIDGIGMTNVMPSHPPAHQVSFMLQRNQFALKLSFEKYPGEKGVSATNVLPMGWTSISARGQLDSSSTIGFTECVGGGADIRPLLLLAPRSLCLLACNSFNPQPLIYNLTNSNGCGNL